MNKTVRTYADPKAWKSSPIYEEMKTAINICATTNQKNGIVQYYNEHQEKQDKLQYVFSFREFIRVLFEEWYSPETRFQQYLKLSTIIHEHKFSNNNLRTAFKRNAMDVLNSIRLLIEGAVQLKDLSLEQLSEKEQVFFDIWEQFMIEDEISNNHYKTLRSGKITSKQLNKAAKQLDENFVESDLTHVILHGFYFVTPEQQIIFERFDEQIKITLYHYFDERYSDTFDFIEAFTNEQFGWPSVDNWLKDNESDLLTTPIAHSFLNAFEDTHSPYRADTIITRYHSFFDFLQDVILPNYIESEDETQQKSHIIAANSDDLNDLLISYFPELNKKKRNFLTYPIGRFLVGLHQIYNDGQLILNEEILVQLFSSGWLHDSHTKKNAHEYTQDLKHISPYFEGCSLIEDWLQRIDDLAKQSLLLQETFPVEINNRRTRSISNPFRKLAYFDVDVERVVQIKNFMQGIQQMVTHLFDSTEEKGIINTHFTKLRKILQQQGEATKSFANEREQIIIQTLEKKLSSINDSSEFLYEDLQTAIQFYLSGKLDSNEPEIIQSFMEIDGEMFKEYSNATYITGLDERTLPLTPYPYPWPLQVQTFEQLCEKNNALNLFMIRNLAMKQISRYLFFIALNLRKPQVHFSWIENMLTHKDLRPALYVSLLEMQEQKPQFINHSVNLDYIAQEVSIDNIENDRFEHAWQQLQLDDFKLEYAECPRRFYYSHLLQEYPTFVDPFAHEFIYTTNIQYACKALKISVDEAADQIESLFPHLSDFTKKYIQEKYVYGRNNSVISPILMKESTEIIEGNYYTNARYNLQFAGYTNDKKKELINHINTISLPKNEQQYKATPGYQCRFCPHIRFCKDAKHAIDLKKSEES